MINIPSDIPIPPPCFVTILWVVQKLMIDSVCSAKFSKTAYQETRLNMNTLQLTCRSTCEANSKNIFGFARLEVKETN